MLPTVSLTKQFLRPAQLKKLLCLQERAQAQMRYSQIKVSRPNLIWDSAAAVLQSLQSV